MIFEYIFWILLGIIVYNYLLYVVILSLIYAVKTVLKKQHKYNNVALPDVTLLIPAYNESEYINAKIENTNQLNYPAEKLHVVWVTDGSNDGTYEKLKKISGITLFHENERRGKIGAVNRVMKYVKTPFVVFTDTNSMLNKDCINEIIKPFSDNKTGCVAGKKKIIQEKHNKAVAIGEGVYWKYESLIKRLESSVNSTVGAAGEIFAIRTGLFEEIPGDSIIEDFVMSLNIIRKKYKTKYTYKAIAEETSSLNIKEELKRKVRIAYGSIQTLFRYPQVLNPFITGFFSFQYFSHKVLRWTIVPVSIPVILLANIFIVYSNPEDLLYKTLLIVQIFLYALAFAGFVMKERHVKFSFIFTPYYFLLMNFSIIKGYFRYLFSRQNINWEKAKRA